MGKSRTPSPQDKPKNHKNSVKKRKIVEANSKLMKKLKED